MFLFHGQLIKVCDMDNIISQDNSNIKVVYIQYYNRCIVFYKIVLVISR